MDIDILKSFSEIKEYEWEMLWKEVPCANIYQTWKWYDAWERHLGCPGQLRLIVVRDGGKLIAVAPLYLDIKRISFFQRSILTFVSSRSCAHPLDQGPLVLSAAYIPLIKLLAETIVNMGEYDIISFELFEQGSPAHDLLEEIARRINRRVHYRLFAKSHMVSLETTYENFLGTLGPSTRKNIRKVSNRFLSNTNNKIHKVGTTHELNQLLNALGAQKETRFRSRGYLSSFTDAEFTAFLKDACSGFLERGRLIGLMALVGDTIAATQLILIDEHGHTYGYNSSFEPEYEEMRIHYLLESMRFREVISLGHHTMDLSTGYSQHKSHWTKGNTRDLLEGVIVVSCFDNACFWIFRKIKENMVGQNQA